MSEIDMFKYENLCWDDFLRVSGTDEVGRGALAGPIVAASVVMPQGAYIKGVTDSKKLSQKRIAELACDIKQRAVCSAIVEIDATEIDLIGIERANNEVILKSILKLSHIPNAVIVDGAKLQPYLRLGLIDTKVYAIDKADNLSYSVACASIIAKAYRDSHMIMMARKYPKYGFAKHKGYGTPQHIQAIREHGRCNLHRYTFKVRALNE